MRQVDRSTVGIPKCLDQDLTNDINLVIKNKKLNQNIYRNYEVVEKLKILYLNKCYLCEADVKDSFEIEHFLPWSINNPERAYDWSNLHLSCKRCNQAKRNKKYKEKDGEIVTKTILIDPSNPPFCCTVEQLIKFNKYCEATSAGKEAEKNEVKNTISFINSQTLKNLRQRCWSDITQILLEYDCINDWRDIVKEPPPIELKKWESNPVKFSRMLKVLDNADIIYSNYLIESAPFYTCIKYVIFENLRLSVKDFQRMSNAFRDYKGMPYLHPTASLYH